MPANQGAAYVWPPTWPTAYWNQRIPHMPPDSYPNFVAGAGLRWPPQPPNPPAWPTQHAFAPLWLPQPSIPQVMPPQPPKPPNQPPVPPPPQASSRVHRDPAVQESESDEPIEHEESDWAAQNIRPPNASKVKRYNESAMGVNIESWLYQM